MAIRSVTGFEAPPTAVCHVQMLGGFRVVCPKGEVKFKTRKTASLLAHLCFFRGRSLSKEAIVASLWPEADDERGRQSLRAAVSALRAGLTEAGADGNRLILSDRHTIEAAPEAFWSDVDAFRAGLELAGSSSDRIDSLSQALGSYGGHLLPSHSEEWVMPQALELEELHAQAVVELTAALVLAGRAPEALAEGKKALALSPLREDLHIAVMRAHAAAGQASAAIRQYEVLERLLDEQWGEAPSAEATAVIDGLPTGGRATMPQTTGHLERAVAAVPQNEARNFVTSPIVGRATESARVLALLTEPGGPRLVTLTGIGGTGKTALARAVADQAWPELNRRVWFIELAGLASAAETVASALSALGVDRPDPTDPVAHLRQTLSVAPSVLVLDNAEHMIREVIGLAQSLTQDAANVRLLVTSRVPLGVPGESVVPVAPLRVPGGQLTLDDLRAEPAVQILTRAAQTHRPGFAVTPDNARSVQELCLRLQGFPLALELAAAQLRHRSPAQVLASLGRILDIDGVRSGSNPRQRDLRAVIGWSAGLLTPAERQGFCQLSVAVGPLSLDDAESLLGHPAADLLDRLALLSLGEWKERGEVLAFETLEPVREFAQAWLAEDPKQRAKARERHFMSVLNMARGALADEEPVRLTDSEQANVLVALAYAADGTVPASWAWDLASMTSRWIAPANRVGPLAALARTTADQLPPAQAARAWRLVMQAHYDVRDLAPTADAVERSIAAARLADDPPLLAQALVDQVIPATMLGDDQRALDGLDEAESLLVGSDHLELRIGIELNRAWIHFDFDRPGQALPLFERAVAHAEEAGEPSNLAGCLTGLGCAQAPNDFSLATRTFERSRELAEAGGKPSVIAHGLYYRALAEYRAGNAERAAVLVLASLQTSVSAGFRLGQTALSVAGTSFALAWAPVAAVACWSRADALARRSGTRIYPTNRKDAEHESPNVIAKLTPLALKEASEWGTTLLDEEFVARLQSLRAT